MPHRHFIDSDGTRWDVWDVDPIAAVESLRHPAEGAERPALTTTRLAVSPALERGWLCFERSGGERRRLAPVPDQWHDLQPEHLERLCEEAEEVAPRKARE